MKSINGNGNVSFDWRHMILSRICFNCMLLLNTFFRLSHILYSINRFNRYIYLPREERTVYVNIGSGCAIRVLWSSNKKNTGVLLLSCTFIYFIFEVKNYFYHNNCIAVIFITDIMYIHLYRIQNVYSCQR